MKPLFTLFLVFASAVLIGADLTTKSGEFYRDFSVIKVTHHGVMITSADGLVTIPLSDLPDDMRKKYAADVERLRKEYDKKALARRRHNAEKAALRRITLIVPGEIECIQVLPNENAILAQSPHYDNACFRLSYIDTSSMADGNKFQGADTVLRIDAWSWEHEKRLKTDKCKAHILYCIGQYQYTTTSGGTRTIPNFTLSRSRAWTYLRNNPNAGLVGIKGDVLFILPEELPKLQQLFKEHIRKRR